MAAVFELVIINSSDYNFIVSKEALSSGFSNVMSSPRLIAARGVQRYKVKAGAYNTIKGEINFCEQSEIGDLTEFTVAFHHRDGKWTFDVTPIRTKEFYRLFSLNATEYLNRGTLSLGVAIDKSEINT